MRGRKPKPTAAQISAGDPSKIGKRKLQQKLRLEPAGAMGLPPHPRHLGGRARDAWIFWSAELAIMNLDRRPDAMMLEGACVGYAQAVQADILIENDGPVVDEPIMDTMGEVVGHKLKRHPAVTVSRTAWAQVRAFATEFGLSPVSRTRLAVERQDATPMELSTLLATPREPRKIVN